MTQAHNNNDIIIKHNKNVFKLNVNLQTNKMSKAHNKMI